MFESNCEILASSDRIFPMVYSYPDAESVVNNASRFAYIVHTIDPFLQSLVPQLDKINTDYLVTEIGDFTVIHNLSRPTRPKDVLK